MTEDSIVDNMEEVSRGMVLKYAVFDVASYHVMALVESEVSRRATTYGSAVGLITLMTPYLGHSITFVVFAKRCWYCEKI